MRQDYWALVLGVLALIAVGVGYYKIERINIAVADKRCEEKYALPARLEIKIETFKVKPYGYSHNPNYPQYQAHWKDGPVGAGGGFGMTREEARQDLLGNLKLSLNQGLESCLSTQTDHVVVR